MQEAEVSSIEGVHTAQQRMKKQQNEKKSEGRHERSQCVTHSGLRKTTDWCIRSATSDSDDQS